MLSLANATPVADAVPEVVTAGGYPIKEADNKALQLHELLEEYNRLQITNINAAFFFCKTTTDEKGNVSVEKNTEALKKMALAIYYNLNKKPAVSFVIDEDIFKNPEAFAQKYANRRPEHKTDQKLAERLLLEEATIIRECLSDPEFLEGVFTDAIKETQTTENESLARIMAQSILKGRIATVTEKEGKAVGTKEYPLSFRLTQMPEGGLKFPSWIARHDETGKELYAIQNASPETDKKDRAWAFTPDVQALQQAYDKKEGIIRAKGISLTSSTPVEQWQEALQSLQPDIALLATLNPERVKESLEMGEHSVDVQEYLTKQQSLYHLHEGNTTGIREFTTYPKDFQVKNFPNDYGVSVIRAVSNAYFFTGFTTGEDGTRSIHEDTTHLKELAKNIYKASLEHPQSPSKVILQVDDEVFTNPSGMGPKYAHLRPEENDIAAELINDEARIVHQFVTNPANMQNLFAEAIIDVKRERGETVSSQDMGNIIRLAQFHARESLVVQGIQMDEPIRTPSWTLTQPHNPDAPEIHSVQWAGNGHHSDDRIQIIGYPAQIQERLASEKQALTAALQEHGLLQEEQTLKTAQDAVHLVKNTPATGTNIDALMQQAEKVHMWEAAATLPAKALEETKAKSANRFTQQATGTRSPGPL